MERAQQLFLIMNGKTGSASVMGDGEKHASWCVFGGSAGRTILLVRNLDGDNEFKIGMFRSGAQISEGDSIDIWSDGGGGYGDLLARDLAAVLEDVMNGYVSIDGAYRDYAVVIRERDWEALDYELDLDA